VGGPAASIWTRPPVSSCAKIVKGSSSFLKAEIASDHTKFKTNVPDPKRPDVCVLAFE